MHKNPRTVTQMPITKLQHVTSTNFLVEQSRQIYFRKDYI